MRSPGFRQFRSLAVLVAAVSALSSGCGSSHGSVPRSLPPTAPVVTPTALTPRPHPSGSPTDPRAAEAAVVRDYFRIINHLNTDMDAAGLAALMAPSCECQIQPRSVRRQAALGHHYVGTDRINALRPNLDGRDAGDVLVDFDTTRSGIVARNGEPVTTSAAAQHLNRDFVMRRVHGRWLIARIDKL